MRAFLGIADAFDAIKIVINLPGKDVKHGLVLGGRFC